MVSSLKSDGSSKWGIHDVIMVWFAFWTLLPDGEGMQKKEGTESTESMEFLPGRMYPEKVMTLQMGDILIKSG